MNRSLTTMVLIAGCALTLHAQQAPPPATMSGAITAAYNRVKNNVTKAADKMPEADYSFKPTPAQRDFGGWVAHLADAQMGACSRVAGAQKSINAAQKKTKAELVAALKESFDACDAVYNTLTEANASDAIAGGSGPQARLAILANNTSHSNEGYGSMAVYMRLKGQVPPSSE